MDTAPSPAQTSPEAVEEPGRVVLTDHGVEGSASTVEGDVPKAVWAAAPSWT